MNRIGKPCISVPLLAAAIYLLLLISGLAGLTNGDSTADILISATVLQVVIFVLTSVFYARMKEIRYIKSTGLRPFAPSRIVLLTVLLGIMLTGAFLINIAVYSLTGSGGIASLGMSEAIEEIDNSGGRLLTVLSVCIMPAVCEEFAFRGVMLSELTRYRALPAVLGSAVLFAGAHFDLYSLPSNIFCGIVLAALVLITRSLISAMVLHAVYNICTVFLVPYIWRVTFEPLGTLFTVFILAGIFMICLALVLGEIQAAYAEYARNPAMAEEKPDKDRMSVQSGLAIIFINPALLLCIVIFLVALLIG